MYTHPLEELGLSILRPLEERGLSILPTLGNTSRFSTRFFFLATIGHLDFVLILTQSSNQSTWGKMDFSSQKPPRDVNKHVL